MSEKRRFDCPACGVDSWFQPDSLQVEHGEPKCEAWNDAQKSFAGSEAFATVVLTTPPPEVIFNCPDCAASVRMRPRDQPISVAHSLPYCESWERIEGKKDDVERFLIKAGVHVLVPERN